MTKLSHEHEHVFDAYQLMITIKSQGSKVPVDLLL